MAKAKFIGVYASTRAPSMRAQPTGTPKKRYWFAWEDGWGRFRVQLLDGAFQPLDNPRVVDAAEFKKHFEHQPTILVTPVVQIDVAPPEGVDDSSRSPAPPPDRLDWPEQEPKTGKTSRTEEKKAPRDADKNDLTVVRSTKKEGIDSRRSGRESLPLDRKKVPDLEVTPAPAQADDKLALRPEDTFEKAALIDKELRTEFKRALNLWSKGGDKVTPLKVCEDLYKREEGIIPAHKHMYTDFAIDLRKSGLPALAVRHFQKAVDLAPDDCNAQFNLARIYYDTGKLDLAEEQLERALELAPDFEIAARFLNLIRDQRKELHSLSKKSKKR